MGADGGGCIHPCKVPADLNINSLITEPVSS